MEFNLKDIEKMARYYKRYTRDGKVIEPCGSGIEFIETRINDMRNPDGNVAPYYWFFEAFARRYKPEVVVELGGWRGTAAACFAAGNPDGIVITIDHHSDPGDELNIAWMHSACKEYPNIKYCNGWTCDILYNEEKDRHHIKGENAWPKVLKELDGRKIDVLFIDSWHSYRQAKKDWYAYRPLLNSPALVIADDIYGGADANDTMKDMEKFWDEMTGEKFLNGQIHAGYPMGFLKYTSND